MARAVPDLGTISTTKIQEHLMTRPVVRRNLPRDEAFTFVRPPPSWYGRWIGLL
jgi:hypothetical protein